MIRGGYRCVCFTEAPLVAFKEDFVRAFPFTRYSQFGLMLNKSWLYDRGGRPVIYQPDSEFDLLPEQLRWRHVRFEPTSDPVVDFTWEREWRIRCDDLPFSESDAVVIVPNSKWANALVQAHEDDQNIQIQQYSLVMEAQIAELLREEFHWRLISLK